MPFVPLLTIGVVDTVKSASAGLLPAKSSQPMITANVSIEVFEFFMMFSLVDGYFPEVTFQP
jgi:hypothetical protein